MIETLFKKITSLFPWLSIIPVSEKIIEPQGITHTDNAAGMVVGPKANWLLSRNLQQELQIHSLREGTELTSWQTEQGGFSNLLVSNQGNTIALAYQKDEQHYLAYFDSSRELTVNLTLSQWQLNHPNDCQIRFDRLLPYDGDSSRIVLAGRDTCEQAGFTPWVGVFDDETQQWERSHQFPLNTNYQNSVYDASGRGVHVTIPVTHHAIEIYDSVTQEKNSYSSRGMSHYSARLVPKNHEYHLCAFSRLDAVGTYGFLHMRLSNELPGRQRMFGQSIGKGFDYITKIFRKKNEQWFTIFPNHIAIPDPTQVSFDCSVKEDEYYMSATWTNRFGLDQSVIMHGDKQPTWIMFPKLGNSIGLRVEGISGVSAAVSFKEDGRSFAGEISFLSEKPNTPCDMVLDSPIFIGISSQHTTRTDPLVPIHKQWEPTHSLTLKPNLLAQLFPACQGYYPTIVPTDSSTLAPTSPAGTSTLFFTRSSSSLPSNALTASLTTPSPTSSSATPPPTSSSATSSPTLPSANPTLVSTVSATSSPDKKNYHYLWFLLAVFIPIIVYRIQKRRRKTSAVESSTSSTSSILSRFLVGDHEEDTGIFDQGVNDHYDSVQASAGGDNLQSSLLGGDELPASGDRYELLSPVQSP